jgi:hypothetical protein
VGITELTETIYTRGGRKWCLGAIGNGIGYAAAMSFKPDELALLEQAEEVDIETQAPEGPAHRATIWIVVDQGSAYVRSVRGPAGRWYRELLANPAGALHVGRRRLPVTAIPAADPDSVERVSKALRRKYKGVTGLSSMLKSDTFPTTLRLEPA